MKRVIFKDAGIDKVFIIKKAKAMASFNLFMDLNRVIEKAEGMYAAIAQQFMHNCMQTGTNIAGVSNSDVEKAIQQHSSELMYFIFNSFFKELDKTTRDNLLEQIFTHVVFMNGTIETPLSVLENNSTAEHIDLYIENISTIFGICQEFMRYNFAHFLPQKVITNLPEDQKID